MSVIFYPVLGELFPSSDSLIEGRRPCQSVLLGLMFSMKGRTQFDQVRFEELRVD